MKPIAVCIPTRKDQQTPGTLAIPLVCLALQSYMAFNLYIRDEGDRDAYADPSFRMVINLLAMKGVRVNYWRTRERKGAGFARRALFGSIRDEEYLFWLDDDMVIEPNVLEDLVRVIENDSNIGFVFPFEDDGFIFFP